LARRVTVPPVWEGQRVLELRPNCERCDVDLPPESTIARVCTYECTFCADCVADGLQDVCPNCGGNFVPRPIRPRQAWRDGTGLMNDPASTVRHSLHYSNAEVAALTEELRGIDPRGR
jgi:hypothetical protein